MSLPAALAIIPGADDVKLLLARECARVSGETTLRKMALTRAGMTLGRDPRIPLETAEAALMAAARAGNYPATIDGEDLAAYIRTWLQCGLRQRSGADISRYRDEVSQPPEAPPVPAPDPGAAPAAPAVATDAPPLADPDPVVQADQIPAAEPAAPATADPILQRADALAPAPVDWLWKGAIARGKLALIGGAPGTGKSTLALGLIAAVSSGGALPGGESHAAQGSAILVCEAASLHDTIVPGLMAAGADRARIGLIADVPEKGVRRAFDLNTDLAVLERAIETLGDVRLIVIDPVNAFAGADAAREDRLGALLHPLAALAEKYAVAIVVIAHPVKGNYLKPNVTSIGALALNAAARTSFLVHTDPIDPRRRFLLQVKNSLAADRGALAFTIERREAAPGTGVTGAIAVWERRRYRLTPDEVIGPGAKNISAKADARAFLHHLLADKPAMPVQQIEAEARAAGLLSARQPISQCRPLRDARLALKLVVTREGFGADGRWVWAREDHRREAASPQPPTKSQRQRAERKKRKERAKRVAARAASSMEKKTSMENTTSMASVPAPALVPGQ
jgi:hypothetical protein